jgi:phospholipase/carboxylesterase
LNVQSTPIPPQKACIIWLHGLGADGSDMAGLAAQMRIPATNFKHVFLDAPFRSITINNGMRMRAWYDIVGDKLTDRQDEQGIGEAQQQILTAIDEQIVAGFTTQQIFLAGFSQGGAMALYTALNQSKPLAGVVMLSGYLPLAKNVSELLPKTTPLFMACGRFDPIVLPQWTKETLTWVKGHGYQKIDWYEYSMQHTICHEEIVDLSCWLTLQMEGITNDNR